MLIEPSKAKFHFYTVDCGTHERHFFTMWELLSFLAKINLEIQKN